MPLQMTRKTAPHFLDQDPVNEEAYPVALQDGRRHSPKRPMFRPCVSSAIITSNSSGKRFGRVRQCGVKSGVATGLHFQAALGVVCSGCASSIIGVARAAMPSICM